MKQMDVFKKIGGILKELNDQYDYLSADPSELNELELELFVANAHFLKDHAEILRRINERAVTPAPVTEKPEPVAGQPKPVTPAIPPAPVTPPPAKEEALYEQRFFEPVVQQHVPVPVDKIELTGDVEPVAPVPFNNPVKIEVVDAKPEIKETPEPQINIAAEKEIDSYSFQQEIPEGSGFELNLNEADTWDDEADRFEQEELISQLPEKPVEVVPIAEQPKPLPVIEPVKPAAEPVTATAPATDTNSQQVLTFNQRIMAQKAEKANTATNTTAELPVTDLKSAINLNDKLLYIKDLFNGYSLAYSEAIEIVNRFSTFEEAEHFLKTNYVVKNNWESKASTADKFYALLRRRYPAS
ncbi:hypothetical protein SAMN05192574_11274 [Mucilaginibacter gossypiicola]|uniref:Uncharacterized protein n=1 Tax=Mucilaginibacter gossypiicola TaxID=551995 RepID=A0A1H8SAR9_9SPHI|nr:hypothetical protein [Mucilaginibacter gossypiicola]SEO75810.1 hypothetical protein SAMN05192574_11274 [Mucilaginibacter gossypiicola]